MDITTYIETIVGIVVVGWVIQDCIEAWRGKGKGKE